MCYNNYHLPQSFINDAIFLGLGPWWSMKKLNLQHHLTPTHVHISTFTSRFYYTYIGLVHHNFPMYREKAYKCMITRKKKEDLIVYYNNCHLLQSSIKDIVYLGFERQWSSWNVHFVTPLESVNLIGNIIKPI